MKASNYERAFCSLAEKMGYHAERVAGSGVGKQSVCDVVMIKDARAYLVEVKSTRDRVFYVSDKQGVRERLMEVVRVSKRCGAIPLIAVRFKGGSRKKMWVVRRLTNGLKKVKRGDASIF